MPKFDITEISDYALLRMGGQNEELMDKAQADLIVAREAVNACKDRLAALQSTAAEVNAEITRRGLNRFVEDSDA